MNPQELEILHLTTALRIQMLDSLTDADLAFKLPNNPTLGELCIELGKVQRLYIDSFKTLRMPWEVVYPTEPGVDSDVEKLKAWFKGLDDELLATLQAIPAGDFQSKLVDRGGGFMLPLGGQFHVYREAILIFCGKCKVYLLALGKPLTQQWREWIG